MAIVYSAQSTIAHSSWLDLACEIVFEYVIGLSFSLQEHTGWVYVEGVQLDHFQVISCSGDGILLIHDFLDPTPPILTS